MIKKTRRINESVFSLNTWREYREKRRHYGARRWWDKNHQEKEVLNRDKRKIGRGEKRTDFIKRDYLRFKA